VELTLFHGRRCQSERIRRVSRTAISTQYPYTVTSAGLAVIDSMNASIGSIPDEHARNADTLAARLSPYYTSSLSLSSGDAEAVQTLISIAQSSLSDVNDDFDATQNAEEAVIESCAQGQAENEHYYAPDAEYICLNQEWRVVAAVPRPTNYQLYSVLWTGPPTTAVPNCFQTIKSRGIDIVLSDVGGGIIGALFFGPIGAFGGATVASGEMFYFHIYEVVYCFMLGTPVPIE